MSALRGFHIVVTSSPAARWLRWGSASAGAPRDLPGHGMAASPASCQRWPRNPLLGQVSLCPSGSEQCCCSSRLLGFAESCLLRAGRPGRCWCSAARRAGQSVRCSVTPSHGQVQLRIVLLLVELWSVGFHRAPAWFLPWPGLCSRGWGCPGSSRVRCGQRGGLGSPHRGKAASALDPSPRSFSVIILRGAGA